MHTESVHLFGTHIRFGSWTNSAASSTDCCAIDGSIDGANPSIASDNIIISSSITWRESLKSDISVFKS